MNWYFLLISIIIIVIGSLMSSYNSQPGVPISKQNTSIYTLSIVVVVIGVLCIVGMIGLIVSNPPILRLAPGMVSMVFTIGFLLTGLGAYAVSVNNGSKTDDDKSDEYIKISTAITSIGVLFIGYTIGTMTHSVKAPTTSSMLDSLIPSIGPLNITSLF